MDFYGDTLFASCGAVLDGDSVNRAVKFVGGTYEQVCSGPVGVEVLDPGAGAVLLPNPAAELVSINCSLAGPTQLNVHNALGDLIHREQLSGSGKTSYELDIREWSTGVYIVTLRREGEPPWSTRLVIER